MIEVVATKIDHTFIYYECPFCYTLRNGRITDKCYSDKTKKILASAKSTIHRHGSNGFLKNRKEYRGSHCLFNREDVCIIINDTTLKPKSEYKFFPVS